MKIDRNMTSHARALRRESTPAEVVLWARLKGRQLGGYKFRRQQPIGRFVADFLCVERKVVIELDGGQHNEDSQLTRDDERTRNIEAMGYRVLRFWNIDVSKNIDGVMTRISEALSAENEAQQP